MSSWELWSDNPNAPQIPRYLYIGEKATLAGSFVSSILYGVLVVLFFQCMAALFDPIHRRGEGIKWWLVSHTAAMFSFVTVYTAMNLRFQSNSFIDNREFSYGPGGPFSGPFVYQFETRSTVLGFIPNVMFNLNNWLTDGLLIYRCYIIYSRNLWAIVLPCLTYLASIGMGIVVLYFQERDFTDYPSVLPRFCVSYLSISVSLNVLLTLMIVIRLILHGRNIRAATGSPTGINRLYKAISTMLIESCALFAMTSLVVVVALVGAGRYDKPDIFFPGTYVLVIFFPILAETQVIAPLLIVQRVANRSALTSHTITTGHPSSFNVRRQGEPTASDGTPLDGYPTSSAGGCGKNPGGLGVMVETTVDFHLDDTA